MTRADIISMTQTNLDIVVPSGTVPAPLQKKIDMIAFDVDSAISFIAREGVSLSQNGNYTIEDAQLIVMYAAWLYRKRGSAQIYQAVDVMPRMLRFALNNRLFSEKAGDGLC